MDDAGFDDLSLYDLFRMDAQDQVDLLADKLLLLADQKQLDAPALQALMRGAHSFKGAARIVGLDAAVHLTHALESRFVAAMEGTTLTPGELPTLLAAVDVLRGILRRDQAAVPAWLEAQAGTIDQLVAALEVPDSAPAEQPPTAAADPEPQATAAPDPAADSNLRISTQRFDRILSLASDSLVQTAGMARMHDGMQAASRRIALALRRIENSARDRMATTPEDRERLKPIRTALHEIAEAQLALQATLAEMDTEVYVQRRKASGLHHEVLQARLRPFSDILPTLRRLAHDVSQELGKQVHFQITGERTEVDRDILEQLRAPLEHLLRNAIDHGLESPADRIAAGKPQAGTVQLAARHENGRLLISLTDDGAGIHPETVRDSAVRKGLVRAEVAAELLEHEMLEFLFLPGFTTRSAVTEISGRGFGLDVVQSMVHEAGGSVRIQSTAGAGAGFYLTLPVTRSTLRVMRVEVDDEIYALPLSRIARVARDPVERGSDGLLTVEGSRGNRVPVVRLSEALGGGSPVSTGAQLLLFLLNDRGDEADLAFSVARLLGDSLVAVRPLDERLGKLPAVAAVTLSDMNVPMLILEPGEVLRAGTAAVHRQSAEPEDLSQRASVLVVDDSHTVRQMLRRTLLRARYRVSIAQHGAEAWSMLQLQPFDLLVSDVDMPEMNGIELVEHVRDDARLQHLPIVLLSYKAREDDRRRGLEAGADAYVTKGEFAEEAFLQVVTDLIGTSDPLPAGDPA